MSKSDQSKHRIVIAAIKRHTILPSQFQWTRFYEIESDFVTAHPSIANHVVPEEYMICSVVINADNYSLLTTRKLITKENGNLSIAELENITVLDSGNFKNTRTEGYTMGSIRRGDGTEMRYFIETGPASMVMIYGVQTLAGIL